ncbi:MAG: hypothetical protein JW888_04645 [Pirellulales bacterium]|nr:hypothetical protein [Pirellulales bacterium]
MTKDAAEFLFEAFWESVVAQRATGAVVLAEGEDLLVGRCAVQQTPPTGSQCQQRSNTYQAIVFAFQVCLGTALGIVARRGPQAGADRFEFDVPGGGCTVDFGIMRRCHFVDIVESYDPLSKLIREGNLYHISSRPTEDG